MPNILLVEDSGDFQMIVKRTLGARFQISCVSTAAEALSTIQKTSFDLILLDVRLPDSDGFQLCAQLKNNDSTRNVPIIFLTGKSDVNDKVLGFSLGADDYIVKPFDPLELRARVESKLNRIRDQKECGETFRKGNLVINVSFQKATLITEEGEKELGLTPIELKLLTYFARFEEHVISRNQLMAALWGEKGDLADRTIDKHISALRQKLGIVSHYIQTVPGSGYRFSATPQARKAS